MVEAFNHTKAAVDNFIGNLDTPVNQANIALQETTAK
jgi:ABC-type transporter lipoprotein component MlaA